MITQEYLKSILHYNSETGIFTWLRYNGKACWRGRKAGALNLGYVRIRIDGKYYRAARLAWLYMTGEWPEFEIDHVNGWKADDRWCNLREATRTQNSCNIDKYYTNTSGFKGVYFNKQRKMWLAQIRIGNGKRKNIGYFSNLEEAGKAYQQAALKYHGEFAKF